MEPGAIDAQPHLGRWIQCEGRAGKMPATTRVHEFAIRGRTAEVMAIGLGPESRRDCSGEGNYVVDVRRRLRFRVERTRGQ